jgi:hypothetical protein
LLCKTTSAIGSSGVAVTISRIYSLLSSSLSYDVQTVSTVTYVTLPLSGSSFITNYGQNFGTLQSSLSLRLGFTSCVSMNIGHSVQDIFISREQLE